MTERQYNRLLAFWRKTPRREALGKWAVKLLPPVFFCVYGAELLILFWQDGIPGAFWAQSSPRPWPFSAPTSSGG